MFTRILVAVALVLAIATASVANESLFFLTAMWGGGESGTVYLTDSDGAYITDFDGAYITF